MHLLLAFLLAAAAQGPAAVVDGLYQSHFAHHQRFDATMKAERARFGTALLAQLDADAKASAANSEEVVGLDFDPLTNSQEEADGYSVGAASVQGDRAAVPVEIRLGSEKMKVEVRLVRSGGTWAITNLAYTEGDLAGLLQQLAKERR